MKGKSIVLFCLGLVVGIGCGFGGSYLIQQMFQTDMSPTTVTSETDEPAGESKTKETETEPTNIEPVDTVDNTVTENNTQSEENATEVIDGTSNNVLFSGYDWPEAEINGAIPQPNFGSKPTSVSVSSGLVQTSHNGVSVDNALAYVEELKNLGYIYQPDEIKTDSEYCYSAWNGEDVLSSAHITISYKNTQEFKIIWTRPMRN